jgi:hypothetical protein
MMDWIGNRPPVTEDLEGCKRLRQGGVHIKTIHETGVEGTILGYHSLESDNLESNYFQFQSSFDDSCGYKSNLTPQRV